MSSASETLARIVAALNAAGARHMIVGSFASTFHGEPRTTQDIDVVVELGPAELERLLSQLPESEWYVDAETARDALRRSSTFNVIDYASGWKVDVIVRKSGAFAASEFARRIEAEMLGVRAFVATAEDTLLSKLVWAKASGGSERQLRDVAGVLSAAGDDLDREYVERWVDELGIRDIWERVRGG